MAKARRTWSDSKKRAVLQEIAHATSNGGTILSVLKKHNISHGMYKRWNEELGGSLEEPAVPPPSTPKPRKVSTPPATPTSPRPTTLNEAITALRVKRDMLSEVITDLERMEKV
jgi:transposase-like protein